MSPPGELLFHVPWFLEVSRASVDAAVLSPRNGVLEMPTGAREVRLGYRRQATSPALSYQAAVEIYTAEYKRRYEHQVGSGQSADLAE